MTNYGYQQQYSPINRPVYGTNTMQMPQSSNTPRVRPVSSLDEVRAMSIDFDGTVFYFPDYANRKIYTKQINMDGTATINMYESKEIPNAQTSNVDYITRDEFNQVLAGIKEAFLQITQAGNVQKQETDKPSQPTEEKEKPQFNF